MKQKWKINTRENEVKRLVRADRVKRYEESRFKLGKKEEESGYIKQ